MARASTSAAAPPFGKHLASNDKATRDKAIKDLSAFLSDDASHELSPHQMAKLWKGIWYCFWMSDKPLVQQALAQELAEMVLAIPDTSASLAFLRGFWTTAVREWNGIDHFRLDKFYMLVRRFVNAAFRLLIRTGWSRDACDDWNLMLTDSGGPLCADDVRVPVSLTFHLVDIYLEELDKVLRPPSSPTDPQPPVPLITILLPFLLFLAHTQSKSARTHLRTNFLDPLLDALKPPDLVDNASRKRSRREFEAPTHSHIIDNACTVNPSEEGKMERNVLRKGLMRKIFDVAKEDDTKAANRKLMFAVYRQNIDLDEDETEEIAS